MGATQIHTGNIAYAFCNKQISNDLAVINFQSLALCSNAVKHFVTYLMNLWLQNSPVYHVDVEKCFSNKMLRLQSWCYKLCKVSYEIGGNPFSYFKIFKGQNHPSTFSKIIHVL